MLERRITNKFKSGLKDTLNKFKEKRKITDFTDFF